jgi:RNA polymerase sigma factor (sigma-70 family)
VRGPGRWSVRDSPETRLSLLARVKNPADPLAWEEFAQIYRPLVYRLARKRGLQHADAEDLVQQVLCAVARAMERWQPDAARGRFRTWLYRVSQNLILNWLARDAARQAVGGAFWDDLLRRQPESAANADLMALEWRREVFRWTARQIRDEFHPDTWRAFWRTAVEGQSIDAVALEFGKSPGAVYAARSRVMRRLRDRVQQLTEDWEAEPS